ncbi:MAG: aspartyl-tRNA(Asn)/glutamyl-tRNA(Gln) amidotransferase subunit A [Candidatus Midichloriaceae bacterium]|jgi:aspartyl-tRNA(Asn)/glutamyl-tRNA(Gln) amidotransferase subunit A
MHEILNLPYYKIKKLLKEKQISASEVIKVFLDSAAITNKKYNALREITDDYALNQAKESQKRIDNNEMGKIEAMPVAIKDNYCTKGVLTTASSKMLENFIPNYESTVTEKLFENGGIMIGKANMDEFAMGSSGTNSYFGKVINPHKANDSEKDLVAGGSSGGSASAVTAKMSLGALGTDTGGSVRLPASFTGLVGLRPTYGTCSRYGIISFASSLDQAGIFANNLKDTALIFESIAGFDEKDSTSKKIQVPNIFNNIESGIKGKKIGIPKEQAGITIDKEITNYIEKAKKYFIDAGAEIVEISLPHTKYALATYYIISSAEVSSNLSRYDGVRYGKRIEDITDDFYEMVTRSRSECFGEEVKRRIISGTYVLSASHFGDYYEKAQKVRRLIHEDYNKAFSEVDAILTPTSVCTAFAVDEKIDPIKMYNNDLFTVPASLAGLPAISVPVGLSNNGLPIGLQLIGKSFDEQQMFNFANVIEQNSALRKF